MSRRGTLHAMSTGFVERDGALWCEGVLLEAIAQEVGTPTFVYSASTLRARAADALAAIEPIDGGVRYAVKACSNLAVLRLLVEAGLGMDVVSHGELARARAAGCDPERICFAGVGKGEAELEAALGVDGSGGRIGLVNVESESELVLLAQLARTHGVVARALLRVNPGVDAAAHRHTTTARPDSKFGLDPERALDIYERDRSDVLRGVEVVGFHAHIGSPIREPARYAEAAGRLVGLAHAARARGGAVEVLNLGGGFAHAYGPEEGASSIAAYIETAMPVLAGEVARGTKVLIEPGRSIAAGAGALLVRAVHTKENPGRSFVMCDAGMNALARPALYDALHRVAPVRARSGALREVDVVGPLCESGDFLARGRALPPVERGDVLAVFDAGAYGMSMASNYNEHPKPAEVLVDGDRWAMVRRRQTIEELRAGDVEAAWRS